MSKASGPSVRRARDEELEACREIRYRVFVLGQGVPAHLDDDGLDPESLHLVAHRGDRLIGTARLRELAGQAKVERVSVLESERGGGAGRALMDGLEAEARARGLAAVILSAQEPVVEFYLRLGYAVEGERYMEAGIPHLRMRKPL